MVTFHFDVDLTVVWLLCRFMWQMCGYIPTTLPKEVDSDLNVSLMSAQLSASFVLETLIHAKEKVTVHSGTVLLSGSSSSEEFYSLLCLCQRFFIRGPLSGVLYQRSFIRGPLSEVLYQRSFIRGLLREVLYGDP